MGFAIVHIYYFSEIYPAFAKHLSADLRPEKTSRDHDFNAIALTKELVLAWLIYILKYVKNIQQM